MHINELFNHINNLREQHGLAPKSKEEYLAELIQMKLEGKIQIENGEVKPVKDSSIDNCNS